MTGQARRPRTTVEVVAVVAVIAAIALVAPDFGYESRYRYDDVAIGEQGRLRDYDVTVSSVRLTRNIEKYSDALTTEHAFVVLTLRAVVRNEGEGFRNAALITRDGRRYQPKPDWITAALPITQPGFTATGVQVYEVPRSRLRGAQVIIGPDQGETTTYDAAVRVDLALSGDEPLEDGPLALPPGTREVTR
jgi:hypothetical protein